MKISFKKIMGKIIPRWISTPIRVFKRFNIDYGHWKTTALKECVDRKGNPIPWYSYPAIEYIEQLDFSEKSVFEYGSGHSTLFWMNRCHRLVSIEHDPSWHSKIQPKINSSKVDYRLVTDLQNYVESIQTVNDTFDVIIIDGKCRYDCAQVARKKLSAGGLIILDNSDWHVKTAKFLKDSDLIEVDMSGFSPINHYSMTTSFFLSRDFNVKNAHDRQPIHSIAALKNFANESHEI